MKTAALRIEFEKKLKELSTQLELKDHTKIAAATDLHPRTVYTYLYDKVGDLENAEKIIVAAESILTTKAVSA